MVVLAVKAAFVADWADSSPNTPLLTKDLSTVWSLPGLC